MTIIKFIPQGVNYLGLKKTKELSYCKQSMHQLRTQYVDGIYRPNYPVTLKSRSRVTQGHCNGTIG